MKKFLSILSAVVVLLLASCMGGTSKSGTGGAGGEVTGVSGSSMQEPSPYGMVLVKRGSLKMGTESTDSLWGKDLPTREISVDAFWMDEHEVT
ncbi:MAG: SUMF1/EgtB/PvdO family nonheme iron enzyme, partial [Bacteroidaceae bacterium]|nr:SUMF1/EgtB/PvdO family nonheme iron enzyme [Bacteroidaceae bacterium]